MLRLFLLLMKVTATANRCIISSRLLVYTSLLLVLLLPASFCSAQDSAVTAGIAVSRSAFHPVIVNNTHFTAVPGYLQRQKPDSSSLSKQQINKRIKIIAAANIAGYGGAMVGLYDAWYKNYPQSNFHFFNDFPEWQQIDKIGHAYSAYAESKASMELWRWTGIDRKKRIWIGGMSGAFYQTVIETLDGFSSEWGWSWGDFGANIFGSGLFVAQELAWDEQRIQYKFSFHRKHYSDPQLNQRSDKIFGTSTAERFLKDYNGQTYWLSCNIKSFFPQSKIPRWLQLAVGTGAEGMFGAVNNIGRDANGAINFNRTDIKRYRQWYLAPDIDLSKIKTKKKGVRIALDILNIVKFPLPAIEYGNGQWKMNWVSF